MEHCLRCGGLGVIPTYKHIDGGVCYECGGIQTKSGAEIRKERKEREERNREWKANEKLVYELPGRIRLRKEIIQEMLEDLDQETEEDRKFILERIEIKKVQIAEWEEQLKVAKEYLGYEEYGKKTR